MDSTSEDEHTPSSSGYSQNDPNQNDQEQDDIPPQKKSKMEIEKYSSKAYRIMKNMGYSDSTGLGKRGQGRIEPVEASQQKGRRGLGAKPDGLDMAAMKFESNSEIIQMPETVIWLKNNADDLNDLNREILDQWIVIGNIKMTIDDETKFCDPSILEGVLKAKSAFDKLGAEDMRRARQRSNPFETIRGVIFLNRAAVKMANMDALLDNMFTNPVDKRGQSLVENGGLLYFADVCAGPGGFSEYILWRKNWHAKGFGFTLKEENDFNLDEFLAGHPETFDPYYGCNGNGNVFDPANIESLTTYILSQTEVGVHFMMADGGFSVKGKENLQEILSKQLYLCQCLVALCVVRERGHFVVKLFDLFTPFSVGLIYLMYKCFEQISIIKPNTSRPANSERYLVCKWKKSNTDVIQRHLFEVNSTMFQDPKSNETVLELVPYNIIQNDEDFFEYIYESNNRIGTNQITGLLKIAAFYRDSNIIETRQAEIRSQCLQSWNLPDMLRKAPQRKTSEQYFSELLNIWSDQRAFMNETDKILTNWESVKNTFDIVHDDWYFVALDTTENIGKNFRTFFMSRGRRDVLMYNPSRGNWFPILKVCVEMSPNTLIYGEIVKERQGEDRSQKYIYALHIIDGIILGGEDIRNKPLSERNKLCQLFAKALNKPNVLGREESVAPIRCKQLFHFKDMSAFFDGLEYYRLKEGKSRKCYNLRNTGGRFFVPRGLLFLTDTKFHIKKNYSKRQSHFYYYDTEKKTSFYLSGLKDPGVIKASFRSTFRYRYLWKWDVEEQILLSDRSGYSDSEDEEHKNEERVYRSSFEKLIRLRSKLDTPN